MRCRSMGARGWRERPSKHGRRLASHRSRRLGCRSHAGSADCANGCLGNACRRFQQRSRGGFPESHRGKYLAFTDLGTTLDGHPDFPTGLSYLKKLGITAVQLMRSTISVPSTKRSAADTTGVTIPSITTFLKDRTPRIRMTGPCASARSSRWCRRCIMPASK